MHQEHDDTPRVETFERADEGSGALGFFLAGAAAAVAAILCFTPVWDMVAPDSHRSSGRRAWFNNLLLDLGPGGVAAILGSLAVVFVLVGWWEKSKAGSKDEK
ncbi:hypothetical protein [Zhihengliuella sp. ISTPL4]|uniref:hypothetical protein n=1 Tax=Zhihengliuella sp. ISTPL4 TaxID=2058657 RepID=UPI000C7E77CF|nr:hypothetical protein [Zhihengliuella sp. ISTPL4]